MWLISKSSVYYVSPDAIAALVEMAQIKGYVSYKAVRKYRGLANYVAFLSRQQFVDTRPQEVKDSDVDRLNAGLFPYWALEDTKFQLRLAIDFPSQLRLMQIASDFMITNHRRKDSVNRYNSTIGAVLEAIGIRWLTIKSEN